MANAEFVQRYGIPAPATPKGNYPATIAELIQGGLHIATNESDMLLILPQYRETGMEVNVLSTQRKYRLIRNPDTQYTEFSDWRYIPDGVSRVLPLDIIRVDQGTDIEDIELPTNVIIYYGDGNAEFAPVLWNTVFYDPDLAGYQMIEGTYTLPNRMATTTYSNVNKCYQIIQVISDNMTNDEYVISSFAELNPISVIAGAEIQAVALPSKVVANVVNRYGNLSTIELSVIWDYTPFDTILHYGITIYGEVTIAEDSGIANPLKLKPQIVLKAVNSNITPQYRFSTEVILPAGETAILSNSENFIDHIYASDFYGCGNDTSQRLAEIRFLGIVDDRGQNLTSIILNQYPQGIRMPVLTSSNADVAAYLNLIKSLRTTLGYDLEYEIPGGPFYPRVALDDETHRIVFGSAVIHNCKFLIRKSHNTNLLYPDIC